MDYFTSLYQGLSCPSPPSSKGPGDEVELDIPYQNPFERDLGQVYVESNGCTQAIEHQQYNSSLCGKLGGNFRFRSFPDSVVSVSVLYRDPLQKANNLMFSLRKTPVILEPPIATCFLTNMSYSYRLTCH